MYHWQGGMHVRLAAKYQYHRLYYFGRSRARYSVLECESNVFTSSGGLTYIKGVATTIMMNVQQGFAEVIF